MSDKHEDGRRHGIKQAVAFIHARAAEMNDPSARMALNAAAFHLGQGGKDGRLSKDGTAPPNPAPAEADLQERIARGLFDRGRIQGGINPDVERWEDADQEMQEWLLGHASAVLALLPATQWRPNAEPHVFLDCDGVLADFDAHGLAYFGKPPREAEAELGSKEFWRQLEARGDFYRSMPLMPDARELFDAVKHLHPTILTGCPKGNWAQGQKVEWAAEHFPGVPIITCRSADKRDYARPGDVLIDDWPQHRHRWIEMGGHFITHHDAKTSIAALWAHYPMLPPPPSAPKAPTP